MGDEIISKLVSYIPCSPENMEINHFVKVLTLLKAHFSRELIVGDLLTDQKSVLIKSTKLLSAMVDVIASEGWVGPLLATIELSQMVIQGQWSTDSPLMQLPHVHKLHVENCLRRIGSDSLFGLLELKEHERRELL